MGDIPAYLQDFKEYLVIDHKLAYTHPLGKSIRAYQKTRLESLPK